MNGRTDTERILGVFLAPEADRLPDRVIDAALTDIARTSQRRALRVPWRFPTMPALNRATGIAAVALVAVVGAGGLIYLNSRGPSGAGTPTATPPATQAPTEAPTAAPSPEPTDVAPGIKAWTTYTSAVYGITVGYPNDWDLYATATRTWQPGNGGFFGAEGCCDIFTLGNDIAVGVWQQPASAGDLASREALAAWAGANHCDPATDDCATLPDVAIPLCVGTTCAPAILVPLSEGTFALLADPAAGVITIFDAARQDDFEGSVRYGGTIQLLTSILSTMDVNPAPDVALGIRWWRYYTSAAYGITVGYPNDWDLYRAATRAWQEGDTGTWPAPWADVLALGNEIALGILQRPASAADLASREGLAAWAAANYCGLPDDCAAVPDNAIPMCVGRTSCGPAIIVPLSDGTYALLADPEAGLLTIVDVGRPDNFEGSVQYGGTIQLLTSILSTMDVYPAP